MKKIYFPYIAVVLSLTFMPIIVLGNMVDNNGARAVPLLSLLVMNEFAFFVSIAGLYIGIQQIRAVGFTLLYGLATMLCLAFTVQFTVLGMQLWPT
ncbi:hypothetical protein [Ghiorsea bivora]|uniref:hypothetical protein n=1 Tax=Ghiorsea bivora TaxID=1485545 RepID=UPI000570ED36|nr:hypothetical protein [Ghiorsea bivora]